MLNGRGLVAACPGLVAPVTPETRRQHVADVLRLRSHYQPAPLPAWRGTVSLGELVELARRDATAGDWLEELVRYREQVTRLEAENEGRCLVVLGALVMSKRLEDWTSVEVLLRHLVQVWGLRDEPTMDPYEQRVIARRLSVDLSALPAKLRTHAWRPPLQSDRRGRGL